MDTVMELAALLAVGLGDWIDFGVILGILLLNAFVGFYQEKQASDVVASLKGDIALRATVVRDGKEKQILAKEIVPGDIVCCLPCCSLYPKRLRSLSLSIAEKCLLRSVLGHIARGRNHSR